MEMNNKQPPVIKSRYISFILYADNPYHMDYLHYLEDSHDGFYILHEKGDDNYRLRYEYVKPDEHSEKAHFHVILRFQNARSETGFLKSLPNCKYYKRVDINEEKPQLYNCFDVVYCPFPVEEIFKPLLEHAEPIVDIYAYSKYILHRDFESVAKGKKPYCFADVKPLSCDREDYAKYFEIREISDSVILDQIYQYYTYSQGNKDLFIQLCMSHSDERLLKYLQSHSYFINKFIFERNEVKVYE